MTEKLPRKQGMLMLAYCRWGKERLCRKDAGKSVHYSPLSTVENGRASHGRGGGRAQATTTELLERSCFAHGRD